MAQDTAIRKPRRFRRWLLAPVLLVLLVGGWYWRQPKRLHLAARIPCCDFSCTPCPTGILTQRDPGAFVLHDWRSGKPLWRVQTAGAEPVVSASLNGHYLAQVAQVDDGLLVQCWLDGVLQWKLTLPYTADDADYTNNFYTLVTEDNGRVLCWRRLGKQPPIYLLDGRIVASGRLPVPGFKTKDIPVMWSSAAPDGTVIMGHAAYEFAAFRVIQRGNTLILNPCVRGKTGGGGLSLFTRGAILEQGGKVYYPSGKTSAAKLIEILNAGNGAYTLQMGSLGRNNLRAFAPGSGDAWAFAVPGAPEDSDSGVSANGRFAAVYYTASGQTKLPPALVQNLQRLPWVGPRLKFGRPERNCLALYARPGRKTASLELNYDWAWPEQNIGCGPASPAPDGRSVVVMNTMSEVGECVLLRY